MESYIRVCRISTDYQRGIEKCFPQDNAGRWKTGRLLLLCMACVRLLARFDIAAASRYNKNKSAGKNGSKGTIAR